MAENTPPSVLRDRLKKTLEINDFLENELTEICEFTMYEKQLLMVEQGCSEFVDKNRQLQDEIQNLTKTVQSRDDVLNGVKNDILQKKIRFSSLKDNTTLLTTDSSGEGAVSPSALINEVLSTFDALSKCIENGISPEEAKMRSSIGEVEQLNITGEELKNGVSKLRQILETSVEEGARRFSDSMLIREKLKSRASLFGSKEIAVQTNVEGSTPLDSVDISTHLLDISNVGVNYLDGGRTDNLMLASNVEELERELLEVREQCKVLSSANEDLEKLLSYKEHEIQKLNEILNIPKSPCTCRKSTIDQDVDYEDDTLSCPVQPVVESFHGNSSSINNSFLPTILEVKESSFDGSFDENNVPDFTSPPSAVSGIVGMVDSEINLDAPRGQGDRVMLEKYRAEIADLQKCRNLLAGELEYCLSELDYRDEQITLLQSNLPVAHDLCARITASADLFKQCNEEIETLEILVEESEGNVNNELNAEVTGRLVNVLNIIQKGIDTVFAVSVYPSTDPRVAESSFANMSSTSLANVSSYPQQFCSVLLDSTVNLSLNDSAVISPNVALSKPGKILKDVRNLRQSIEMITSDFTREFFNVISKLERVESIILWFRNMDSDDPLSSVGSTKPSNPIPTTSYRNVLIEDIKEKAQLILDLQKSRSDKQCTDSSQAVSAQSSDESLIKAYSRHGPGSVLSYTDSSVYASATDGDEANLHFMCSTDSKCDIEVQTSFDCSDALLSTLDGAFDCSGDDSQKSDKPNGNITADQDGCKDILEMTQSAETILSAFWKTVNDFSAVLQGLGIPTSKTVLSSDSETLTLEKIESYAGCVREVLSSALLHKPLFCTTTNEKANYDPDCTELLSLDITSLNEDDCRKKPLLTSVLLTANQNIIDVDQEGKENSFPDDKVALSKAVRNWEKLIHDSNKRIAELLQSKNNIEVRLSEKIADNNNLVQQLNKAKSDVESRQEVLREKTEFIEDLIANKDVHLDNIKSEVSLVQEEASKLKFELKNTKESWNLLITDFMKQYQDLTVKIDSFQTEIDNLQKEKLELDSQLRSASTTIKGLRTDLLNKEQLQTLLKAVEERLAEEVTEKEELKNNLQDVSGRLYTAEKKVADFEREISSLNDNLLDKDQLRTSFQMVEGQLAKELAQKEELQNNLQDVTNRLNTAENKVTELEVAILDKRNRIQELQDSVIGPNEHQDRIANLEHSVSSLTKTLDETRASWTMLIETSSTEIDQLKTSLKTVEVQSAKEFAKKTELEHSLHDVEHKLFTALEKVSDLEREMASMKENLLEKDQLETSLKMVQEQLVNKVTEKEELQKNLLLVTDQLSSAEKKVADLERECTAVNEKLIDKDQLRISLQKVEDHLATEMAEKEELKNNLHDLTDRLSVADKKVADLEREISSLNENLVYEDQLRTALQMVEERLAKENAEKEELKKNLEDVSDKLSTADMNVSDLKREITALKEKLLDKDQLRIFLHKVEDHLATEMAEKEELKNNLQDLTDRLSVADKKVADLEREISSLNENLVYEDQLRTSLQMVEERLAKEKAEKEELQKNLVLVTDQLSSAEKKVADLERECTAVNEKLFDKDQLQISLQKVEDHLASEMAEKEELKNNLHDLTYRLSVADKKVADLEREISSLNENLVDGDRLRTSLQMVEEQLAKELAEKEELKNNLQDFSDRLSTADNQFSDFKMEITALNEKLLDNDRLKGSLLMAEEQLAKELTEKEKLRNNFQNVTDRLSIAEKKVTELEEAIFDKTNRIQELQDSEMVLSERKDRISNLEHTVTTLTKTLEETRVSWNTLIVSSSTEIDQLKTCIKTSEVQLAEELAKKMELENMLHDVDCKLSTSEKRVSDLEREITSVNEDLLEKVGFIRDFEAREIGQNEHLSRIAELQQVVDTLTSALDETKMDWNDSIKSSSAKIDQLQASLKVAEEQLVKVVAEKEILENISKNVTGQLSIGMKAVSDLERELSDTKQVLAEKNNYIGKLEGSMAERDEFLIRNKKLVKCNNDLALSLHLTRENWSKLMESSRAEIDRLTVLCSSLSYQQSVESLKYACLSNNFQTLVMNCKECFRQHDQLLKRIEVELTTTSLEKENLSNRLEETLVRFEGIKQTLMEKEDNFNAVLMEQERLFSDKFAALDDLEGVVSNLRSHLTVAQGNRKKLILEAKKRIDEMNTSKKRAEVQVMLEIVKRKKVSTKLEAAVTEMENLRKGLRINEGMISDMQNSLSSQNDDEEALNQTNNFAENHARDARNELMQAILCTKEKFGKLCEAERSLSIELDEEKASNIELSSEHYSVLSSIAELEENIRRRPSPLNDIDNSHESSLSSFISDSLIKSTGRRNHSVVCHTPLGNEDEFEVTAYNATVHLEQSVFVSDLVPMEMTVNGEHFDPLNMSINPELAATPRKRDAGNESTDESEFGTPVATKFWEGADSSDSPRQVGTDEKTSVNSRKNISANVTKNLAHLAAIEENAELQGKIKTYETDLLSLQAKVEDTSTLHEQLNQRIITIQNLVDGVLRVFYNRVPELPMEQNIVNISKDITNLTEAIIESTGSVQNCLMDSVRMLITDGLPASSHVKDNIASTNAKIGAIAEDCFTLKKEMLQFSQLLAIELASAKSSISSSVEQNLSSLSDQITLKNAAIEELTDANDTLQHTLLTASLEKESLRDLLNDEISRTNSLKGSFEEQEKELETKCIMLREECDENLFRRNNIVSIILELLRQWNGDEEAVSEDVVQELKLVFAEAVHAKNMMKARTNKTINFNFMKGIEEILSKNELLEDSLSNLKSQLSKECKNLSTGIKNIKNENKNLLLDFTSSKNEIEGALHRVLSSLNVLREESLQNLSSKEDIGILEERLKECQDRISNYETTFDEASSKCSSLTAKVKLLEENNSSLSTDNEALIKDVSDSETKNKELCEKLGELKASNGTLSSEMAKLQETILELNKKLSANELQLSACENQKFQVCGDCSLCGPRELELETIRKTIISVVASTVGKPIDLSSSRDDIVEKLTYIKRVLSKSNDTLQSVMKLLNSQELSGVIALECLYRQLKSDDVRDAYLCKKKFADEIHGMDAEMQVKELIQLSLLELQSKFMSAIMEKEESWFLKLQEDHKSQLASKAHQLSQYEDKEKLLNEMVEDLTKENEKLEETLSNLRTMNVREDIGHSKATIGHLEKSIIDKEENKILTEELETLNTQISALKSDAAECANKFKLRISDLETILKNFSALLSLEESVPSSLTSEVEFELKDDGFPIQLAEVLRGMFSRLSDMRKVFFGVTEKSKEDILAVEHLNTLLRHVENEHAGCKETELKLGELHKELGTKEVSLSKLNADYANLETQLNELKKSIVSKDEVVAHLTADKASLELELEQSKKYIDELKSRQIAVTTRSRNLNVKLKDISRHLGSIKAECLKFQNETMADNLKILSYFQTLNKQISGLVENEKNKVGAFETEVKHLHGQMSALNEENSKLANEKRDLESSLANLSAEKQSLYERLKKLEDAPARTGHDDKSCPYKEKVQEYKKEVWIIRQKLDDEQKKFDVMKKNIEEDLAFKTNIIKKLEERNENSVSQFNLRLASSTTSYNQVCKKLEEAEEKISFLRDMNSQDKKRLEKDIDNLGKEISKLQSVKTFVEGLGVDCNKLQETLPEIKKKLSEYENLQTTWSEMVEKNKELEEECEFMNKQIEFLETRNTEMFKQNMEVAENLEKMKKELADNLELIDKSKRLQEEIDSLKLSESKCIEGLGASQVQLNQSLKKLSEVELKYNQLQNAYKLLETNLESRNQKILHYVSEINHYEKMLTEKTKMNQEVMLALEEERSKYADLALQKSSVEKDLNDLQKDLGECHARLKELGFQLEAAANVEVSLRKVSAERDEALRSYSDLKCKMPMAQQMIREKENLVEALRSSYEKLATDKKENEDILKARERELVAKIEVLKTEASDKAVRIVQLESLMESSQTVTLEGYKTKISSLETEVGTLKKELLRSSVHMSPGPQHVTVEAASLSNKLDTKTRAEFERHIHKLEKNQIVLKRLCQMRREKMLEYENLLRTHNIHVPTSTDHSL